MDTNFKVKAVLEDGNCSVTVGGSAKYHNVGEQDERTAFRRVEISDGPEVKAVEAALQALLDKYVGKEKKGPLVMEVEAAGYEAYKYARDHNEIKL